MNLVTALREARAQADALENFASALRAIDDAVATTSAHLDAPLASRNAATGAADGRAVALVAWLQRRQREVTSDEVSGGLAQAHGAQRYRRRDLRPKVDALNTLRATVRGTAGPEGSSVTEQLTRSRRARRASGASRWGWMTAWWTGS
jgi:hypothetical protein